MARRHHHRLGQIATVTGLLRVSFFSGGSHHMQRFYVLRFLLGAAEAGFFPGVMSISHTGIRQPSMRAPKRIAGLPATGASQKWTALACSG